MHLASAGRRHVLAGTASLAGVMMAGCIGGGGEAVTVEASITAIDDEQEIDLGGEETIDGGNHHGWEIILDWEHTVEYAVEVIDGPAVDVYWVEDEEFDAIGDDGEFAAIEGGLWTSVSSITDSIDLPEGEYWLVVVNEDLEPQNA